MQIPENKQKRAEQMQLRRQAKKQEAESLKNLLDRKSKEVEIWKRKYNEMKDKVEELENQLQFQFKSPLGENAKPKKSFRKLKIELKRSFHCEFREISMA